MKGTLSEVKMDADAHRTIALGMAQFSFAGALALSVVNAKVEMNLTLTVYYLFLSFLLFLFVINIQTYKYYEWVDLVGDGVYESGTLCLILSLISVISESNLNFAYKYAVVMLALFIWIIDMVMRYLIRSSFLSAVSESEAECQLKKQTPIIKKDKPDAQQQKQRDARMEGRRKR